MPATERFVVDVPSKLAAVVRDQVSSGRFDSLSDAVTAGLEAVTDEDTELDRWLRDTVAPICNSIEAGTATLLTLEEARARLHAKR